MEGIVVVNKPTGMTSHDVVDRVRRKLNMRRVGHAGTLDPMATGVLIMLVGKATKLFSRFEAFDKAYQATVIMGQRTTTADTQGKVIEEQPYAQITQADVERVLREFEGETEQVPPMYSAIKHKGKKLYELARKGLEVEREARLITINKINLLEFAPPVFKIYIECSKGTYVRQLAEDIGGKLGTAACISEIVRTKVGPFQLDRAVELERLDATHVKSWSG